MTIASATVRLSNMDLRLLNDALASHIRYAKPKLGDRDEADNLAERIAAIRAAIDALNKARNYCGVAFFGDEPEVAP